MLFSLFKALTDPIFDKDTYLQIYEPGNFGHHLATDVALLCGLWIVWNAYLEICVYILKMNSHDSYVKVITYSRYTLHGTYVFSLLANRKSQEHAHVTYVHPSVLCPQPIIQYFICSVILNV